MSTPAITIAFTPAAQAVLNRYADLPQRIRGGIAVGLREQNQLTVAHIQRQYLSFSKSSPPVPEGLRVQSNRLRASIRATDPRISGDEITTSIGTNVKYAVIHEFGGVFTVTATPVNSYSATYGGARVSGAANKADLSLSVTGSAPMTLWTEERRWPWSTSLRSPRTAGTTQSYNVCISASNIDKPEKFEINGYYWGEGFEGSTNTTGGNCVTINVPGNSTAAFERDAYINFCYKNPGDTKSCGTYIIATVGIYK